MHYDDFANVRGVQLYEVNTDSWKFVLHSRNTDFADDDNYETMVELRSCHINHSPRAFGVSLFKSLFFCVFFTILTISIFYKKNFVDT